jgi:hypothetical protein
MGPQQTDLDSLGLTGLNPPQASRRGGRVHGYADGGAPDDINPNPYISMGDVGSGYLVPPGADPAGSWNNLPDSGVMWPAPPVRNESVVPMTDPGRPDLDYSGVSTSHNSNGDRWTTYSGGPPPEGMTRENLINSMDYPAGYTDPYTGVTPGSDKRNPTSNPLTTPLPDSDSPFMQASYRPVKGIGNYAPEGIAPTSSTETEGNKDFWSSHAKLWPALMSAGASMLASRSPFPSVALGEGALQGLSTYSSQVKNEQDVQRRAKELSQKADEFNQKMALDTKKELLASMKPVVIGQKVDAYGQKIPVYAIVNPLNGEYLDPTTHKPIDINSKSGSSPPVGQVQTISTDANIDYKNGVPVINDQATGKIYPVTSTATLNPEDAPVPASERPPEWQGNESNFDNLRPAPPRSFVDENGQMHGEMFLKELSKQNPGMAGVIKQIDEGRQLPPTGMMLRTPYGQQLQQYLAQYDPDFDSANAKTRAGTLAKFKYGKGADALTSFNTSIQHLGELRKAVEDLDNWNNVPQISNWIRSGQGQLPAVFGDEYQKAVAKFNSARTAVTDELTRAFRLSGGNVHDIKAWENNLDPRAAKTSQVATIEEAVHLLDGRIESVGNEFNRGLHLSRDPISLLSPKAKETVNALREGKVPGTISAPNAGTGPKVGDTKQFRNPAGGPPLTGVWDGRSWKPQ